MRLLLLTDTPSLLTIRLYLISKGLLVGFCLSPTTRYSSSFKSSLYRLDILANPIPNELISTVVGRNPLPTEFIFICYIYIKQIILININDQNLYV